MSFWNEWITRATLRSVALSTFMMVMDISKIVDAREMHFAQHWMPWTNNEQTLEEDHEET